MVQGIDNMILEAIRIPPLDLGISLKDLLSLQDRVICSVYVCTSIINHDIADTATIASVT